MTRRSRRLEHLLRAELSELLSRQIRDPRLKGLVTITEVSTSADLREAKVFVSVMGDDEEKEEALQGLNSAAKFLRRELGKRVSLRHTPELSFERDNSIERGIRLAELIKQVAAENEAEQS